MMTCPYGVSRWPNDNGGSDKIQLDLSMNGYDGSNPLVKEAHDMFVKMEEMLVNKALENSMSWFKKKYTSADVIKELFYPIVKFSKDKETGELSHKFPPVIRLTIPKKRTGEIETEVFNNKKQSVAFDDIDWKGASVTAIIEVSSVYVIGGGKFGMTFKARQLKVVPNVKNFDKFAFLEDPDECDDDENENDA
jgi:hypothetical protein